MSDHCTIFCLDNNFEQFASLLKNHKGSIEVVEDDKTLREIIVTDNAYQLILSILFRKEPGDKFSKLILSTHNYFRNIETNAAEQKKLVLDQISNTQAIIGVVGEPTFS